MRNVKGFLLSFCLLAHASIGFATEVTLAGSVSLPGDKDPRSMARIDSTLFVGMPTNGQDEIYAVDVSTPTSPFVDWSINLSNTNVEVLLAGEQYVYVGSGDTPDDFRVLDPVSRTIVASLNLFSSRAVRVMEWDSATLIHVYKNKGSGVDEFVVDVSDPLAPFVVSEADSPTNPVPPVFNWPYGHTSVGLVVSRIDTMTGAERLSYLANTSDQEVQIVRTVGPVTFPDANDDGAFRLGCMGDSNTGLGASTEKWCEKLDTLITDPSFEIRNVGCSSATAVWRPPHPIVPCGTNSYTHMKNAMNAAVDAVVVAYGTNDHFFGYTPENVLDVYLEHQATVTALGMGFYVFTTPFRFNNAALQALNDELNVLISATFTSEEIIDVHTGFTFNPDYSWDGLHFSDAGQQKRAERAAEKIAAP